MGKSVELGGYIADLAREVVKAIAEFDFQTLTGSSVQYYVVLNVVEELDVEPEKCMMHQWDKLRKSALVELIKSNQKVIVNQFPVWLSLSKNTRD